MKKDIETILWNSMTLFLIYRSCTVRCIFFVFYFFKAQAMYFVIKQGEEKKIVKVLKMPRFFLLYFLEKSMIRFLQVVFMHQSTRSNYQPMSCCKGNWKKSNFHFYQWFFFAIKEVSLEIDFSLYFASTKIR